MFAALFHPLSVSLSRAEWAIFAVVVAVMALLAMRDRPRRLWVAVVVAVVGLALTASHADAVPYYCDPIWKYLGICGR